MVSGLIGLLVTILVVGIVAWIILWCVEQLPLPAPFHQIARVLVVLIAVLIILARALPLLGVHVGGLD